MIEIVITDLDGTLLDSDRRISDTDFQTLKKLGTMNVCRVVATGRSLHTARRNLADDFPIDYVFFSSGCGIFDWTMKRHIFSRSLDSSDVVAITETLFESGVDFAIQHPIPENHRFAYHETGKWETDFATRCELYREFAAPLDSDVRHVTEASQIIAIIPNDVNLFHSIKSKLASYKVIRTTSPLDGVSIWIEIFPSDVSKGSAAQWLCERLAIDAKHSLAVGNDYNDIDLLNWAGQSYVVANSPEDLKSNYAITDDNHSSGFTKAVEKAGL